MTLAAAARETFLFELQQLGESVTYRHEVDGVPTAQVFEAVISELSATDCTEDELAAYQRIGTMDMLIGTVDEDGEPVEIQVPGVIEIGADAWHILRSAGRDHGPTAVTESWRIGLGKAQRRSAKR